MLFYLSLKSLKIQEILCELVWQRGKTASNKALGFSLDEKSVRRSGANYIDDCDYTVYENFDDFLEKNKKGKFYF